MTKQLYLLSYSTLWSFTHAVLPANNLCTSGASEHTQGETAGGCSSATLTTSTMSAKSRFSSSGSSGLIESRWSSSKASTRLRSAATASTRTCARPTGSAQHIHIQHFA